jgi:RimJ/RimL family protein N-acetyltransferase
VSLQNAKTQEMRLLTAQDRDQFLSHLLRLGPKGRYYRFSMAQTDDMIRAYVAQTFHAATLSIGYFDQDILRGVVEIHCMDEACQQAELAFSIELGFRGKGLGAQLFMAAFEEARRRSVRLLHIHCLAHNFAMVALLRRFHARLHFEDNEVSAELAC